MDKNLRRLLAALRIALGWIFLWAFIDKLFGLGFATEPQNAWLAGGSPTRGFLTYATTGPFAPFHQSIAGNPMVDFLFMFGLAGLGVALILGIGLKIAAIGGALMMLLMWSAHLPPENNPLIDQHIIYALLLVTLAVADAGKTWGLGRWWHRQIGRRAPLLE